MKPRIAADHRDARLPGSFIVETVNLIWTQKTGISSSQVNPGAVAKMASVSIIFIVRQIITANKLGRAARQ
jgi:hypothetical protein